MSTCIDPVPLINPKTGKRIFVACNKCAACLESRRQMWKFRLMKELEQSQMAVHSTLTFDEDSIGTNELDKRELQLFFKKLRNDGMVFRYYAIGEYGTTTQRKHYHVVLFIKNNSPESFGLLQQYIQSIWKYGFAYTKRVHMETLGYVLHYHIRPKLINNKKTIQLYSKGLGSEWFDNDTMKDFVSNSKSVRVQGNDGQMYSLPRYYRKKYYEELESLDISVKPKIFQYIENRLRKPYFECTKAELTRVYCELKKNSSKKLAKYNHQDKFS